MSISTEDDKSAESDGEVGLVIADKDSVEDTVKIPPVSQEELREVYSPEAFSGISQQMHQIVVKDL